MSASQIISAFAALGALVLMWAGLVKVREPGHHRQTLWDAGMRVNRASVRGLGALEVAVGGVAITWDASWGPLATGAVFTGLAGVLLGTRRDGRFLPCACFGAADTTEGSWWHVGMNLVFAGAALWVATGQAMHWSIGSSELGPPVAQTMLWLGLFSLAMSVGALLAWLPRLLPLGRGPVRELLERRT